MEKETLSKVGVMTVRKVNYDVHVSVNPGYRSDDSGSARFTTKVAGKDIYADTWEDLYKKAMTASKEQAVKVNIPLLKLHTRHHSWDDPSGFAEVALVGKHQKNGNYLIRRTYGNGKPTTEQTTGWRGEDGFYLPMSKEAQAEGLRLMEAHRKAEEALRTWNDKHRADLGKLFDAAEQEAMERLDREEGR